MAPDVPGRGTDRPVRAAAGARVPRPAGAGRAARRPDHGADRLRGGGRRPARGRLVDHRRLPRRHPPTRWIVLYTAVAGAVLLFLAVQGLVGVVALERAVARRCLGPSPLEEYERRIAQLSVSRAQVVDAVDDERRRIERDLHDGVQQRLVALGMLIGRARRAGDHERAAELLKQAHEESQRALADLREVTWRVYPAALDGEGCARRWRRWRSGPWFRWRSSTTCRAARRTRWRPPRTSSSARPSRTPPSTPAPRPCGSPWKGPRQWWACASRTTGAGSRPGRRRAGGAGPAGGRAGRDVRRAQPGRGPTVITAELPCG